MESTNNNNLHHLQLQGQQKPHDNVEACSSSCYGVGGSSHSWSWRSPNTTMDGDDNFRPNLKGSMIQDYLGYNNNNDEENKDMSERLLLKNLSQGEQSHYHNIGGNNNNNNKGVPYISIYPTINISNLNHPSAISSSLMHHHHQPLDLLTSSTTTSSSSKDHHHHQGQGQLGQFTENLVFHNIVGLDNDHHVQQSTTRIPSQHFTTNNNNNGVLETKRTSTLMESSNASKKSRSQSSLSSCQHLKIRKERLGDRIAALQQLVAPFGKTDTASVLLEAIGYIRFLQSQVETLSVPYMKSSRYQISRGLIIRQGVLGTDDNSMNTEAKDQDLRSRGLCLVPMSCMAYIAGDDGGGCGAWQQPPT